MIQDGVIATIPVDLKMPKMGRREIKLQKRIPKTSP
jgi:hypothetical protein